jgi:hypothetical protein
VQTRDTQFHYIVRETGGYLSYVLLGKSVKTPSETIKIIHIDPTATASPGAPSGGTPSGGTSSGGAPGGTPTR